MNPSFPIQRPGVVNSPITDPHLANPSSPASNQWAALDTNPELQQTLCKAAASGQLTQEQLMSFGAYMRGNPSTFKMFQAELQAHQQQQIAQQQQQQQQQQQIKRQQQQQQQKRSEQEKNFHPPHKIVDGSNAYMLNPHPASQAQLPMTSSMSHYQQPIGSSPQPAIHQRSSDVMMASNDPALTQLLTQFRQVNEEWKNTNLGPAEKELFAQRASKLHDLISARMSQLGIRNMAPSPGPSSASQHNNTQPAAQTSPPPHANEIQQAPLPAVYQRQQQMMSSMHYVSQANSNIARPLSTNLLAATSSPRQTLNISERSAASPVNMATSPRPVITSLANPHQANNQISDSSLAQNAAQSSPPALRPSLSPAPPNERSLSPNPVSNKTLAPEPTAKAPQVHQIQAAGANLQPKPPGPVANLASQQHTAIAAQQHQQQQASAQPPVASTGGTGTASNQTAQPTTREPAKSHPTPPAPVAFPPPRPTLTGGHVISSTLAGSFMHQPPTNGINEALGHSSGSHESSTRGADATSANRIISKRKIQELVESIDPSERLETEVEDLLLELADEFIDSVTRFSCQLAKHRKSDRLETKDIQLHLERSWNIRIPGFANDEIRQSQSRRINALPSYQSRVAIVREAIRKKRPN